MYINLLRVFLCYSYVQLTMWITCWGSFLEQADLSCLSSHRIRLEPCNISPTPLGILNGVVLMQVLLWRPYCWEFMSYIYRRYHLEADILLVLWLLASSFSVMSPEPCVSIVLIVGCESHRPFSEFWPRIMAKQDFSSTLLWQRTTSFPSSPLPLLHFSSHIHLLQGIPR